MEAPRGVRCGPVPSGHDGGDNAAAGWTLDLGFCSVSTFLSSPPPLCRCGPLQEKEEREQSADDVSTISPDPAPKASGKARTRASASAPAAIVPGAAPTPLGSAAAVAGGRRCVWRAPMPILMPVTTVATRAFVLRMPARRVCSAGRVLEVARRGLRGGSRSQSVR